LLIAQLGNGGTEKQLFLIAKELHNRNIELEVASLYGGVNADRLMSAGIPTKIFGSQKSGVKYKILAFLKFGLYIWRLENKILDVFLVKSIVIVGILNRKRNSNYTIANLRSIPPGNRNTFNVNLSTLIVNNAYTASYIDGGTF
jgi:hypothetical protein